MIFVVLLNGDEYLFPDFSELINSNIDLSEISEYYDLLTDISTAEYVTYEYFVWLTTFNIITYII